MIKLLKSTIAIVLPEEDQNYVLNPSGEIDGNFSNSGGASTITRVTTFQKYGLYSYEVVTTGGGDRVDFDLLTLPSVDVYVTFRARGIANIQLDVNLGGTGKEAVLLERIDTDWGLYGVIFPASLAGGETLVEIEQTSNGANTFYIDGVQISQVIDGRHYTTYIDGTQSGCAWLGTPHASASMRSGDSRAGGIVTSFWEGFNFFPEKALGLGTAIEELNIDSYAFLPGGELNSSKIPPREFTIIGYFLADTVEELHEHAQRLELELGLNTYPGRQPVRLRYSGAKVLKEISANYTGGLEGDLPIYYDNDWSQEDEAWVRNYKFKMRASIQFVALDPFWYEVGESSTLLDTLDGTTFRYIAGRLADTGQWSNLGVTVDPSGLFGDVFTIVVSPFDGKVYIGGVFEDWNGNAGMDRIAAYDPITGDWEYVGSPGDFNSTVFTLKFGPDGTLYAGGGFTNVAGNASADLIAQKPTGGGWTNLGAPAVVGSVRAITIAPNGDIYIGGQFANWAGLASADNIVYWDISAGAYAAVIAGANEAIRSIVWLPDMSLAYFGGEFDDWGDSDGDGIVSWDGSSLAPLSTGAGGAAPDVLSLVLAPNGVLFLGGVMETLGGVVVNGAGSWNGTNFQALGSGVGSPTDVENLALGPDSFLYLVGQFESAGGINIAQSAVRWNGYTYAHLDIDLPGAAGSTVVWTVAVGPSDPIIKSKYDIFLGFDSSDTGSMAGLVSAQNDGTSPAFPKIVLSRSGGNEAVIQTLRNERTGRELLFNYALLDGESLTIDLNPKNRTIISNFFGARMDAILANSDFSTWQLLPGDNDITSFVSESGSPTITSYIIFREPFKSWN